MIRSTKVRKLCLKSLLGNLKLPWVYEGHRIKGRVARVMEKEEPGRRARAECLQQQDSTNGSPFLDASELKDFVSAPFSH